MSKATSVVALLFLAVQGLQAQSATQAAPAQTVRINGLEITIEPSTGGLLRLKHPGPGSFLETTGADAGIVELAYPIEQFEPLRLAPRYSHDAQVTVSEGVVSIHWPRLGGSRPLPFPRRGRISTSTPRWKT